MGVSQLVDSKNIILIMHWRIAVISKKVITLGFMNEKYNTAMVARH